MAIYTVSGAFSTLSLYLSVFGALVTGLLLAPQELRKDKRILVGVALLVIGAVIGEAAYAAPITCPFSGIFSFLCYVV